MVNCRLCDDSSGSAVVVGYRWMLMVTAKSWGPSAPFDMRLTLAPSRKVASSCSSCLSIATTIYTMSTKAKLTLAATSLGAIGIIIFVHHGQKVEKAVSLSIFLSTFLVLNSRTGYARRCHSRHGAATHKEGTSTGLRYASRAGKGIPQATDCFRRPKSKIILCASHLRRHKSPLQTTALNVTRVPSYRGLYSDFKFRNAIKSSLQADEPDTGGRLPVHGANRKRI